jgi:small membrane protein
MTKFQIIMIASLFFILFSYFRRIRRPALDKVFISLILLAGIIFVFYPELTNQLAHFLGIGRGADLIFYLAILGFGYLALILYSKIRKLEDQLVNLVRNQSLNAANLADDHE